jgi:CRISPR-associated protein Csm3
MKKLFQKLIINGSLECVTGLHIGDSKESTDIGGVDSPVVRRKDNGQPYIPGSSLKGKMRCLLEQVAGENPDGKCMNNDGDICKLFGASENKKENLESLPSRILVRDAFMEENSAEKFKNATTTDMPYTEVKFENVINRVKGTAEHPRQQERVPAGALFNIKLVINVFADTVEEVAEVQEKYLKTLKRGIELINDDYLGGSGSRGYGQVKIEIDWNNKDKVSPKTYPHE